MKRYCFRILLVACVVAATGSVSVAQRGAGGRGGFQGFGGGPGGGRGGFGRGGDTMSFVLREDVQKELALSKDDAEELREIIDDLQQEARDSRGNFDFRNMSAEDREEALTEMREKSAEMAKKARKAVVAKLSSKQKSRYAELEFQYLLQQGNLSGALSAVGEKVDEDELNDEVQKVREEIRKRTAEITHELYAEAIGKVTDADVEKLMGKAFSFESTRPQRGGGGLAGGGGRTGRQRGGGASNGGGNSRRARPSDDANPRRAR